MIVLYYTIFDFARDSLSSCLHLKNPLLENHSNI